MRNNKNKITAVLFVVLSLACVFLFSYLFLRKPVDVQIQTVGETPVMSGDTVDFVSFSVAPGATVSGTITVTGSLKGAYFFEATARGALLDANKNSLKTFSLSATGEWMTSDAITFGATIDATGITPGAGYIRLSNDNPSGDPTRDKYIDIPVVFK